MKILSTLFFCLLFISCNNTGDKKANAPASSVDTPTKPSSNKEAGVKRNMLKQNGDYTSLFNRKRGDCSFITAERLAKVLHVPATAIKITVDGCTYNLTEDNGHKTRFYFTVDDWKNKGILKEIQGAKENAETFGEGSRLSQYKISETGDTYLSMHQDRMVRILNEKAENAIVVFYTPEISYTEEDIDKIKNLKDTARERAYAIANYILNSHKK